MKNKLLLKDLFFVGLVGGLAWLWVILSATPVLGMIAG